MRLSIDADSPFFSRQAFRATVFFNGRKLAHCVEADEERGHATVILHDSRGRAVRDHKRQCVVTYVLHGDVRLVLGTPVGTTP